MTFVTFGPVVDAVAVSTDAAEAVTVTGTGATVVVAAYVVVDMHPHC